jgi:spermidine synthase
MKPFELLGQTLLPDGTLMKLTRRGDEHIILANGATLMSSHNHGSEEALATFACQRARTLPRPSVLVGGLGMGFTLRATLEILPSDATVVVAELVPAVVEWNRSLLGPLAGYPLLDKRVRIETEDVAFTLASHPDQFDAVLLDVDNGPEAFTALKNVAIYNDQGIASARAALKAGGVLAIWAAREDKEFEERFRHGGFKVLSHGVRARLQKGGPRHTIYLGSKA